MSKNPFINAIAASLYIFLIVGVITLAMKLLSNTPDTFMAPVAMISLFTLSAAVMGYLFGFQPAQLYFDGKKKEAVKLFLQTIGIFGFITAVLWALVFLRVFS
ncbi:MAG TPA: hypothetical protein VIK81_04750 [Patescibacteria group bacterium]